MPSTDIFDKEFDEASKPRRYTLISLPLKIFFGLVCLGGLYRIWQQFTALWEYSNYGGIDSLPLIAGLVQGAFGLLAIFSVVIVLLEWRTAILINIIFVILGLLGGFIGVFSGAFNVMSGAGILINIIFLFELLKIRKAWEHGAVGRQ